MDKKIVSNVASRVFELNEGDHTIDEISLRIFNVHESIIQQIDLTSTASDNSDVLDGLIPSNVFNAENKVEPASGSGTHINVLNTLAALFDAPFVEIDSNGINMIWRSGCAWGHISPIMFFARKEERCVCAMFPSRAVPLRRFMLYAHNSRWTRSQAFNLLIRQLLDIFNEFATRSLYPLLSADVICADEDLWLSVDLPLLLNERCFPRNPSSQKHSTEMSNELSECRLRDMTDAWCARRLSNFDYLMKLNEFAGRTRNQPDNYVIMPWVCDFSSEDGGWRPLDRTKYRLNKGDAQLEETYRREPAHHIPELLSDIGYMVYRARREPREALCRVVRSKWVPEEYPRSMARMYEWTPDECIPEFYDDPTLFHSIHPDMCDLEVPPWCSNASDFIKWHRAMLESDQVSGSLHRWIDLVFGYQLSGKAAVSALNVHLSLVQKSVSPRTNGVVQLFHVPHPKRSNCPQKDYISPLDTPNFNPLYHALNNSQNVNANGIDGEHFHLKDLLKEVRKTQLESNKQVTASVTSVAVTILELALAEYCRDLSPNATFADRLLRAKRLLISHGYLIPGHILEPLKLLLDEHHAESRLEKSVYMSSWLLNTFNLPSKITRLHSHLTDFHALAHARSLFPAGQASDDLLTQQLNAFVECLRVGGVEMRDLLARMFVSQLGHPECAVAALLTCFPHVVAVFDITHFDALLPAIKNIYDSDAFYPSVLKLLDRRFLVQLSMAIGTESFMRNIVPSLVELLLADRPTSRGQILRESIVWLSKRYGPIITATHISSTLLRMLALCFSVRPIDEALIREVDLDIAVDGDASCSNVIGCLLEIAVLYGVSFITFQYLPFCAEVIEQAIKRIGFASEGAAVAAVVLLQHCCNSLSDKQLMDCLQECIMDSILFPAVRLFCSPSIQFSSLAMRRFFASRLLSSIHLLACRIGAENVTRYMSCAIQRIFCTFDLFYEMVDDSLHRKETDHSQLSELFSVSFAQLLFRLFSSVCGRPFLFETLPNSALVFQLSGARSLVSPHSAFALSSGNKLNTLVTSHSASSFDPSSDLSLNDKMSSSSHSHMGANCAAHCRAVLSTSAERVPFNHLPISSFAEHSALVRRIVCMDNENCFASASVDKTVKLWSIRFNEQQGVRSRWTYRQHTKPVLDVCLLPSLSLIASTDSSLHVWDPFRGSTVSQFDWPQVGDSALTSIASLGRATLVTASPLDNALRLVDVRAGRFCVSLFASEANAAIKGSTHSSPSATIRCFAISPDENQCAIALSSGVLSILDLRTGCIVAISSQIHSDTLEMRWTSNGYLVSSHLDHPTICWDTRPLQIRRRLPESASMILAYRSQLFSVHSSGRIKVYDDLEVKLETKLKSDSISGSLTSVAFLPNNKMFLFGSSTGHIRLFC
uniref:WD repeat-containing protein n=1 Tax=Ascaris suum TaxID=6253 RepID=F1KRK9_ASCSU